MASQSQLDTERWRDLYEERAAIKEYLAGFKRRNAETFAFMDTVQVYQDEYGVAKRDAIDALAEMGITKPGQKIYVEYPNRV